MQVNSTSRAYHVITLLAATIPPLRLAGAGHRFSLAMRCPWQLARPHALFDADRANLDKESVRNCQAMLVRRRLQGETFSQAKSYRSPFFPFYPQTF